MGYLWYGQQLNDLESEIYDLLSIGMDKGKDAIRIPKCDSGRISAIMEMARLDDPMRFYIDTFRMQSDRVSPTMSVIPVYTFVKKAREDMDASLNKRIDRIIRAWEGLSPTNTIEEMHRFLLSAVTYDKIKKNYSHEIIGVLHHGIGVCEGIAKTVKVFCDRLDIPCVIAVGKGNDDTGHLRHAWNLIQMDGDWLHYDFTFDLSASKNGYDSHRYFAMSNDQAMKSRGRVDYPVPEVK